MNVHKKSLFLLEVENQEREREMDVWFFPSDSCLIWPTQSSLEVEIRCCCFPRKRGIDHYPAQLAHLPICQSVFCIRMDRFVDFYKPLFPVHVVAASWDKGYGMKGLDQGFRGLFFFRIRSSLWAPMTNCLEKWRDKRNWIDSVTEASGSGP